MKHKTFRTKPLKNISELNFSQEKVDGFDLETYQNSRILMIGAGAIGTHVGLGLIRKGIGCLDIYDDDYVEFKNLTRQLFSAKDIGKNKATVLGKILSKHGFFKTTITGFPYRFQEALEIGIKLSNYNAVICGVDNNPTRVAVAEYCLENKIPLIMSAVSRDGIQMYCLIQEPEKACFGCVLPYALNDESYPCNLPGIIDIIQVVAGFTVYALDTILMKRHREWNIKTVFLNGAAPDSSLTIKKKPDCKLCGK